MMDFSMQCKVTDADLVFQPDIHQEKDIISNKSVQWTIFFKIL